MRFRRFIYGCMLLKCVRVELKLIQDLVITIRYQFERIPTTEAASIIYSLNGLLYSQVPLDQRGNYKRYQFRSVYHSNLLNIKCSLEKTTIISKYSKKVEFWNSHDNLISIEWWLLCKNWWKFKEIWRNSNNSRATLRYSNFGKSKLSILKFDGLQFKIHN